MRVINFDALHTLSLISKRFASWRIFLLAFSFSLLLTACDSGSSGGGEVVNNYTVTATAGTGGSITPDSTTVVEATTTRFTVAPDAGFEIDNVTGCYGALSGNIYTTDLIVADCSVNASFKLPVLSIENASVDEGNSGISNLVFTVNLSTPIIDDVSVDYVTNNGSAIAGSDYIASSGTLTIAGGSTSNTINVLVNGDAAGEADETLTLILYNSTVNTSLGVSSVIGATGTIINDDDVSSFTITASAGPGGSISPDTSSIAYGNTGSFTVSAFSGYQIASVSGCSGVLSGNIFTTGAITADCSISASFIPIHTITASAGIGGSISPASTVIVNGGSSSFSVNADAGYQIASVSGCSGVLSGNTYTTGVITSDCSISASFVALHTVSTSAGVGGSISPGSALVVNGSAATFSINADMGYQIASVTGCSGVLSGNAYTTGAITSDCSINASFVSTHTVSTSAGIGGSINPGSAVVVNGESATFSINADTSYQIGTVSGCSGVLSGNSYTTGVITGDCSINASFLETHTITTNAGVGGSIDPASAVVVNGGTATFTINADTGYQIDAVSGCSGVLSGNSYTTGAITGECSINASFIATHTVTTSAGAGGSIDPASAIVVDGSTATFTINTDTAYVIDTVSGCSGVLSGNTYTTAAITSDCSVSANFIAAHTVTANAGVGGSINPGSASVLNGDTALFYIKADAGYVLSAATGCGGSTTGFNPTLGIIYTTGVITADCAIDVSFTASYTVSTSVGVGGSISPVSVLVNEGDSYSFTVTADVGYDIDSVSGCAGSLIANTFTTAPVTADCTINASFISLPPHTVTAIASAGGSISPGSVIVNDRDTTSFTITPDTGYVIDTVSGCAGTLSGNTYSTGPVTADCSVNVNFVGITYAITANAGTGGSITPTSTTVAYNGGASFTLTPDAGYMINSVTGCNGSLVGDIYTVSSVLQDCTINASFMGVYSITTAASSGGTILPDSATVPVGQTYQFSIYKDSGYVLGDVTGCDGVLSVSPQNPSIDIYTIAPASADCTVNVNFKQLLTVVAVADFYGDVSPPVSTVIEGDSTTISVTPDIGYAIDTVIGCDGTLTGNTYTTGAILASCKVTASFIALPPHTVSASAGAGGSISPSSASVLDRDTLSLTLTPDIGFAIDVVSGCDGVLTDNTFTTGPVITDCSVSANFIAIPPHTVTASANTGGSISPASASVVHGDAVSFTLTPDDINHYGILSVTGCSGVLSGNTYTTAGVIADCTVTANFALAPVSVADAIIVEGDSGSSNLIFTVSLSTLANGDVNMDYATSDGSALAGIDYTSSNGTLVISAGTSSNVITVPVIGDTAIEPNETLTISLSNVSANSSLKDASATGTIMQDDTSGLLNDTGLTECFLNYGYCVGDGEDGDYGRDATLNNDSDGAAGFVFSKLDSRGIPLVNQSANYETEPWECVLDNVSGLIWEVKTNDSGLRDKDWQYNWYNSDVNTNGGDVGTENNGIAMCVDSSHCNTESYAAAVNATALCGYNDWRVPTVHELINLRLMRHAIYIDENYFPYPASYWTSTPSAANSLAAWSTFIDSEVIMSKSGTRSVRLIRGQ